MVASHYLWSFIWMDQFREWEYIVQGIKIAWILYCWKQNEPPILQKLCQQETNKDCHLSTVIFCCMREGVRQWLHMQLDGKGCSSYSVKNNLEKECLPCSYCLYVHFAYCDSCDAGSLLIHPRLKEHRMWDHCCSCSGFVTFVVLGLSVLY